MASNFSSLRNARTSALAKINQEIQKENQKGGGNDARFWKLSVDQKTKVGYAVIRFLPAPVNEEGYWARIFNHAFKLNGAWFIENCPTTIDGRSCPVCKENSKLWQGGVESDKDVARERKRKLQFISNILVISDSAHPENNGKVFLFKYGKKIHEKITELTNPQFPDAVPTNPFDLWEGCNFKLKAQQKDGFQNYDKSTFDDPTPIAKDDEAAEAIWNQQHSLTQFVAEKEFKSYEDLEKRYARVLSGERGPATAEASIKAQQPTAASAAIVAAALAEEEDEVEAPAPVVAPKPTRRAAAPKAAAPVVDAGAPPSDEEGIKSFFAGVLN
jgi:hypothetical protein